MKKNCGLVSISFRNKCVNEIVRLCNEAGLSYIEWGGDVHCPSGDITRARELSAITRNAGLVPYCYGSYFRVGVNPVEEFNNICDSASALGAKTIRVWAYNKKYSDCNAEEIQKVTDEAKAVFAIAKEYGLCVNFEYHRSSLTETIDGALKLFSVLDKDVLRVHWQPNPEISESENLRELSLLPRVDLVHVFAWTFEDGENIRHPLYDHHITWREYINHALKKNPECIFELEFFQNDKDEQCIEDAKVLAEL